MKLLLFAQLRFLLRAPWSASTAVLGVAVAVASVVAVHQIGSAVTRSLDAAWPPHLAELSHLLTQPGLSAEDYFRLRQDWRRGDWSQVTALVPIVEGHILLGDRRIRVFGADWLAYPVPTAAGRLTGSSTGLPVWQLLDAATVLADRELGLEVDREILVGGRRYRVAAIVESGLGSALFADIAVAQQLLGRMPDSLDVIGVATTEPGARWRRLLELAMPGVSAALPPRTLPVERIPGAFVVQAVERELPETAFARAILFNVGALGVLALLVAWFLVHQVARVWVARQRAVFARFDAQGVARMRLATVFVGCFALLGVVATVIGTAFGLWLADALLRASAPPGGEVVLPVMPGGVLIGKAVISGIGVCVLGGLLAFRSELRGGAPSAPASAGRAAAMVLALLLAGVGVFREWVGLFGGFAAILAVSLVMILLVRPLLQCIRWLVVERRAGSPASKVPAATRLFIRLGVREAVWQPEVVSAALAALALAIATSLGIGLMVESLRGDFARMMEQRLAGDLYLSGAPDRLAAAAAWLAGTPHAPRLGLYGDVRVRVAGLAQGTGGAVALLGYGDFESAESTRYGYPAALGANQTLVNERLARDLGVDVGDEVAVDGRPFVVAHVFAGFGDPEPRLLVDQNALPGLAIEPVFDRATLRLPVERGLPNLAAGPLQRELAQRFPELQVVDRETLRGRAFEVFDRTFAMTHALTLLALGVAGVGIYNALTALRLNQARTRQLLLAQGVPGPAFLLLTLTRAGVVGVLAVGLALPLGMAIAWLLCHVVNPRAFGWSVVLALEPRGWLPPVLLGLAATVLAGLLPAPRERSALDEAG